MEKFEDITTKLFKKEIDYIFLSKCYNLEKLNIQYYNDDIDFELIIKYCPKLKSISITSCNGIIIIPKFLNLENLYISDCKNLISIDTLPNCKSIIIKNCIDFIIINEDSYNETVKYNTEKKIKLSNDYPELQEIKIIKSEIEHLPLVVPKINSLYISDVFNIITIPDIYNNISKLYIDMYKELFDKTNYYNVVLKKMFNLEELTLICVDINNIPILTNLKYLKLSLIPKIITLPILPNLETLEIFKCRSFFEINDMPKLINIHILKCNNFVNFNIHSSLNELFISKCSKIKKLTNIIINKLMVYHCKYLPTYKENQSIQDYLFDISSVDIPFEETLLTDTYDINNDDDYITDDEELTGFNPNYYYIDPDDENDDEDVNDIDIDFDIDFDVDYDADDADDINFDENDDFNIDDIDIEEDENDDIDFDIFREDKR